MCVRIHAKDVIHYSELLSNVYTLKVGIYDKVGNLVLSGFKNMLKIYVGLYIQEV